MSTAVRTPGLTRFAVGPWAAQVGKYGNLARVQIGDTRHTPVRPTEAVITRVADTTGWDLSGLSGLPVPRYVLDEVRSRLRGLGIVAAVAGAAAAAPAHEVSRLNPVQLTPMARRANRGAFAGWVSQRLTDRAGLSADSAVIFYDAERMFVYACRGDLPVATDAKQFATLLAQMSRDYGIRFWSRGL